MQKKRIIGILLVLSLMFPLIGCGGGGEQMPLMK